MNGLAEGCTYCGSDEHNTTDCRWRDQMAVSEVIAEDNAREVPPSVAEFAVQSVAELQAAIAQRDARIEELVLESERLSTKLRSALLDSAELAALKSRPAGGVVMPERGGLPNRPHYNEGWNACLDEVARLNSSTVSAGECKTCAGTRMVDDGEITHSAGGIAYENGPVKCVKDCPDCLEPSAGGVDEPFMWVRVENDCIEDYTQDKELAAFWMQGRWPVTFPLYRAALNAGSAVPDGWRVMMCTSSAMREADRWEVYGPNGGGVVSTHDVKDWAVRNLLDAIAAAPTAKKEG